MDNFSIYIIINESKTKTYIGFTNDIERRIKEHSLHKVHTTKDYGTFNCHVLEEATDIKTARLREKYWKSSAGRKKLKEKFFD